MNDFSFLDLIWTIITVYALFVLIMMMFSIVADLFRDRELSGWAKAGWIIILLVLPLIGILLYVVTRHAGMVERATAQRAAAQSEFDGYVKEAAGTGGPAQEIASAKSLLDSGAISAEEFAALKAKALG
jgi:hypothetical protein